MSQTIIPLVDLKAQLAPIRKEIDSALKAVIDNTAFVLGPYVQEFETAFAKYCSAEACIGVANGTDALEIALRSLEIGPGDEVITVGNSFFATAEAILNVGATPVFIDPDDDTLLMNPKAIEAAISPRTRGLIPVHLYGQLCNMPEIMNIAERHKLLVIEDAAQAHGATLQNRPAGSWGHAGAFSFYPGKNLGALGDGGAVTTQDPNLAKRARLLRDHGKASKYEHELIGRNSRLDGLQAAALSQKLPHLDHWNHERRRIAKIYDEVVAQLAESSSLRQVKTAADASSVRHLYVLRHPQRDKIVSLLNSNQIGAGIHYPLPLHRLPGAPDSKQKLPISERACSEVFSLPLYPELNEEQIARVLDCLKEAIQAVQS